METFECPYTFGTDIATEFDPDEHGYSKREWRNGKYRCADFLYIFARRGQTINVDEIKEHTFYPINRNATSMVVNIYRSEETSCKYKDWCDKVASLNVKIPPKRVSDKDRCNVKLQFRRHGIRVTAVSEYYEDEQVKYIGYHTDVNPVEHVVENVGTEVANVARWFFNLF